MNPSFIHKLAITAILLTQPTFAQRGPPPAKVYLQTAKIELVADSRPVTGQIRSKHTAELATQVAGLTIQVLIDEGDSVTQGQPIAKLDNKRALLLHQRSQAELLSAQSQVDQRHADLAQAKRDLSRLQELKNRGSVAPAQFDQAQTLVASRAAQLAESRADLAISQSNLALSKIELDDMTITAPFDGRVISKQAEVGQWLDRGDTICTIVSMTDLEARIDVPQSLLIPLENAHTPSKTNQTNQSIQIKLPSFPDPFTAHLRAIVPQADELSRLFPVRLSIDDPHQQLRPGMSLTAMIPTGAKAEHLTISKDAILRNPAGEYVYYNNNGSAALAPITRLFNIGSKVAIRSPMIRPGTQVVVDGNERMYPTQPLAIIQIDGTPQSKEPQSKVPQSKVPQNKEPQNKEPNSRAQQPTSRPGSDQ